MATTKSDPYPPGPPSEIAPTTLRVTNAGAATKTLGPDGWTVRDDNGTRLDDPLPDLTELRQRHEISPDRFHDDFATVAANCGFCAEGGEGGTAPAEEPHHRAARQPTDEERAAGRTAALESMRAGLPGLAAKAAALQERHGGTHGA